ncbi:17-beta-hydroxysteroid dehydrogenase 13 [Lemmus lemmus]
MRPRKRRGEEPDGLRGWRDGSAVGSSDCSSRGPGFDSQHPHGSSQLSVTPVPRDPTPSHRHI